MVDEVLIERRDGPVAVLTLNRPESLNALNTSLMRELVERLTALANDAAVRCLVLTGAGKGFCAGGDVKAMTSAADARAAVPVDAAPRQSSTEARVRWLRRSAEASRLLHEMPKPTIAMINGSCAGAGLSLAAACDLRYASSQARFRAAFAGMGMPGDYGGSWLWTHILGTAKARQLYLLDEKRDAEQALAFGLVDAVYPEGELNDAVMALAHRLAALPGEGLAYAKANLNAALTEHFAAALDRESLNMMLARNVLVEARRRDKAASK